VKRYRSRYKQVATFMIRNTVDRAACEDGVKKSMDA
jgi:hypothetical protein